jgi:hypothetical protein
MTAFRPIETLFDWTIGGDPMRDRAFVPLAVLAKLANFVPVALLFAMARTDAPTLFFASVDRCWDSCSL